MRHTDACVCMEYQKLSLESGCAQCSLLVSKLAQPCEGRFTGVRWQYQRRAVGLNQLGGCVRGVSPEQTTPRRLAPWAGNRLTRRPIGTCLPAEQTLCSLTDQTLELHRLEATSATVQPLCSPTDQAFELHRLNTTSATVQTLCSLADQGLDLHRPDQCHCGNLVQPD